MKKIFLQLTLLVAFSEGISAQGIGSLDKTFTSTGYSSLDLGETKDKASVVLPQPDGKIILIGENSDGSTPANDKMIIVRVDAKGVKDATFGSNGVVKLDNGDNKDFGRDGILLSDGKILVAGAGVVGTINKTFIVKLNANGSLDATFGTGGKYSADNGKGASVTTRSLAQQADGKIVIAGETSGKFFLSRITADGKLDATFGTSGFTSTLANLAGTVTVSKVLIQKDGKIIVVAYGQDAATGTDFSLSVARFDSNGKLDATYGTGGFAEPNFGGNELYSSAYLLADGRLLVGGRFAPFSAAPKYEMFVARLTANGIVDNTFGTSGYYREDLNVANEEARGIDVQTDGKIVLAGYLGDDMGVVRLTANGTLDKTFNTTGYNSINFPGTTKDLLNAVKIDKNNKIVVVGASNQGSTAENFIVARLNSMPVSTFDVDNNIIPVSVFPNPASNSISMTYELKDASKATFELFDLSGKKVATFGEGMRNAGKQVENFEIPTTIANGIYFCRMTTVFGATNVKITIAK